MDAVWAQWEQIKKAEKKGTKHDRPSALDGIPKHLPALLRAEKLVKKARKAELIAGPKGRPVARNKADVASQLFELTQFAQGKGWSAEELLRLETRRREVKMRRVEIYSRVG